MYNEGLKEAVASKLEWHKGHVMNDREARIVQHYSHEVALGRMGLAAAADRAAGDVLGQNRCPSKPQRGAR